MDYFKSFERICNIKGISMNTALVINLQCISKKKTLQLQKILAETLAELDDKEICALERNVYSLDIDSCLYRLFDNAVKNIITSMKLKLREFSDVDYESNDGMYFITAYITGEKYISIWVNSPEKTEPTIELVVDGKAQEYENEEFKKILKEELKDFYTINNLYMDFNYNEFDGNVFDYDGARIQLKDFISKRYLPCD